MLGPDGQKCTHPEGERTNWGRDRGCGRCGSTPNELEYERWKEGAGIVVPD